MAGNSLIDFALSWAGQYSGKKSKQNYGEEKLKGHFAFLVAY
jgi:hypothetical protein